MNATSPDAQAAGPPRVAVLRWAALAVAVWLTPFLEFVVLFTPPKGAPAVFDSSGYFAWFLGLLVLWLALLGTGWRTAGLDARGAVRAWWCAGLILLIAVLAWADDLWRADLFGIVYRRMAVHQQSDPLSDWFHRWHSPWLVGLWALGAVYLHLLLGGQPRRRPRLRSAEVHLALMLAPLLLLGGLLELTLRAGWMRQPWAAYRGGTELYRLNPVVGWSQRPGLATEQVAQEFRIQVRINQLGQREDEVSYARPAAGARILWLGDSFTFGAGVEAQQRFSDRVAAGCRGVESINAGVIGYGTDQEYLYLKSEGLRFQPDLVVLAVYPGNDFYENTSEGNLGYPKPLFHLADGRLELTPVADPRRWRLTDDPEPYSFRQTSRAWQYLTRLAFLVRQRRVVAAALPPQPAGPVAAPPVTDAAGAWLGDPRFAVRPNGYEVTRALLREVRDTCRDAGTRLLVLVVAPPSCLGPARDDPLWLNDARCQRATLDICREFDLPYVDTLPEFTARTRAGQQLYYPRDGHWTPLGHAAAADLLLRRLWADRLLPAVCLPTP